jgi:hypothetical protein
MHYFEQTLSIIEVEQIRDALACIATSRSAYGIACDEPLDDGPVEEALEYPKKVVVTARSPARSGLQETFDQEAVNGIPSSSGVLTEVLVKESQGGRRPVFAVQRPLVVHKMADRIR